MKRCASSSSLLILIAFSLLTPLASQAEVLLDITRTGEELTLDPDIFFYVTPEVRGDSLTLTSVGEAFLFEWLLLRELEVRETLVVEVTVDFTPLSSDYDPTFGLTDFLSTIGYLRSDNNSGALFRREGEFAFESLPAPPTGPIGLTSLGTVDTFKMTYVIDSEFDQTTFIYEEDGRRHVDEFTEYPLREDQTLHFYMGGGNDTDEQYQIHSISIKVTEGIGNQGLAYFPLPNCRLVNTDRSKEGAMAGTEVRGFLARGESKDLTEQGGTAQGCGIPDNAEAIMANVWLFNYDGEGFLRAGASNKPIGGGSGTLIHYEDITRNSVANATVLDLCDNNLCASDFQIETRGKGSEIDFVVNVMGYFAPIAGNLGAASTSGQSQQLEQRVDDLASQNQQLLRDLAEIKAQLNIR